MAFTLSPEPKTFTETVSVFEPTDKGRVKRSIRLTFEMAEEKELQQLIEDSPSDDPSRGDIAVFNRVVKGWPDGEVKDTEGSPVEANAESIKALCQVPYIRIAAVKSYLDAMRGDKPRQGN